MKAIQVRYLPATDRKPSRLKASAYGVKSVTVSSKTGDNHVTEGRRGATNIGCQAERLGSMERGRCGAGWGVAITASSRWP